MEQLHELWDKPLSSAQSSTWSRTGKHSSPPQCSPQLTPIISCTTAGLLCYLAAGFPQWALAFQFLIALDFSSHYMHMYRFVTAQ